MRERASQHNTVHGHSPIINGRRQLSAEYRTWQGMRSRCYKRTDISYPNYGGRGVNVYEPWRKDFREFLRYLKRHGMYPRPEGRSIDRIDNNGHYAPGNIRWATPKQQSENTRRPTRAE